MFGQMQSGPWTHVARSSCVVSCTLHQLQQHRLSAVIDDLDQHHGHTDVSEMWKHAEALTKHKQLHFLLHKVGVRPQLELDK